jgi:outer membrane biosynthesis protein TonB
VISKAVDGVMSLQLGGLAKVLGPAVVGGKAPANSAAKPAAGAVENPTTPKPAATQPAATTAPKPAATAVPQPTTAAPKPAATSPAPKPTTTTPAPKADPRPAPKRETVDEAFKDFKDDGAR